MKPLERNIIIKQLEVIKGAKNIEIGRAANLIWIALMGTNGKDYALHLQTFFRFCNSEKVLITDPDKYHPTALAASNPSFNAETYNWDVQGLNRFDEWVQDNKLTWLSSLVVKEIKLNTFDDLIISFNQDITLTVFLDSTSSDECWRFFEWHSENRHLVVTGRGIQNLEEWSNESN